MTKARIPTAIEQLTHAQSEAYRKLTNDWQSAAAITKALGLPPRYNAGTALSLNRMAGGKLIERDHTAIPIIGTGYRLKQP